MDEDFKKDLIRYSKKISLSPDQYKESLKNKEGSQKETS
jgi:hypothetical protein